MRHVHLHITGIVQGVGMRPFVYREAVARGITGWVLNAGDGVHIDAQGEAEALDDFVRALREHAPEAARIERIEVMPLDEKPAECADPRRPAGDEDTPTGAGDFRIVASDAEGARTTLVSPDIATCPDCLRELFDPADRRYHYPFINCTNCGPRYTIVRALPYDRAATSMSAFPLCPSCAAEYADPADRRFHAQPNACFSCGPHITWRERVEAGVAVGDTRTKSDAIIERCADLLAAGDIVAIKGLGGFHLACNAADEQAVRMLRTRKHRGNKPLAVMARDLAAVEALCHVDASERALLEDPVRPIVLLKRLPLEQTPSERAASPRTPLACDEAIPVSDFAHLEPFFPSKRTKSDTGISVNAEMNTKMPPTAPSVAPGLAELGVMLPCTPLQHLIMAACATRNVHLLVMTSGNASGEPIEIEDDAAWRALVEGGIADALLGNDRPILTRCDDSVARVIDGETHIVRRARGYAPRPLALPAISPASSGKCPQTILVCGAEQKATLALTRERPDGTARCFLSQHIGDVETGGTWNAWHETRERLARLFSLDIAALVCDGHPAYRASTWAREQASSHGWPCIEVQHHHAHIAAVIADAAARGAHDPARTVLGIAFDGTGAGGTYAPEGPFHPDGTVWGGEFLIADLCTFTRAAHLRPWRLAGGAASVRDARRNAYGLLASYGLLDHPGTAVLRERMGDDTCAVTATMVARGLNSPLTTSMGRLLDAIAAILGICDVATYEGEPAVLLEAAAARALQATGKDGGVETPVEARHSEPQATTQTAAAIDSGAPDGSPIELDVAPLLTALLDGLARHENADALALRTHRAVIRLTFEAAVKVARAHGIETVALSGGVFMNRILTSGIRRGLERHGLTVIVPQAVPVNDGCIAYGQAAIARERLSNRPDL